MPKIEKVTIPYSGTRSISYIIPIQRAIDVQKTRTEENNVIPFKSTYPKIQDIIQRLKHLDDGWKNLSPFFNAYLKVFPVINDSYDVWFLIWTKDGEARELGKPYKPIPNNSLLYKHLSSSGVKNNVLEKGEKILCDSFLAAKEFTGKNCDDSRFVFVINIIGEKGYGMCVTGANSIEITHSNINSVLSSIEDNDETTTSDLKNYFKGAFAHEMTHQIRGELEVKVDTGQEIASHAIEILACGGDNPFADRKFKVAIDEQSTSYHKDMVTSLKVVQEFLIQSESCKYKPKTYETNELNKAMKSISENYRERILKRIAREIIASSNIELLRIAAGIGISHGERHSKGTDSRGPG
ncbi:MAG: hypothetical protein HY094_05740 [Candidatus Melainabacteria bacterium]|nr:hypothetical protein [Candidatus Melainabacteria bacterium]